MNKHSAFLKAIIANRFRAYDRAFLESESHFRLQAEEAFPFTDAELAEMDDEERASNVDWYLDDYVEYAKTFPEVLRTGYLIGYYSIYEYFLRYICARAKQHKNIDIDLAIITGRGIFQAKTYLEKICGIKDLGNHQWQAIVCINRIRNSLVHNLGILKLKDDDSTGLLQYFEKNSAQIERDSLNRIIIKDGYIETVSKLFKDNLEGTISKAFS